MARLRRFGFALWLALAVLAGQHAALLHDLAHATERAPAKDSSPAKQACAKCFACANLAGGAAPAAPALHIAAADRAEPAHRATLPAPAATRFAFHSRAPPTLL